RENISSIVGDIEIVVEAFDRAETKAMAIEELLTNGNKMLVSASGMAGLGSANEIITRKVRDNFYLIGDNYSDYEEYSGIMSTRVMICAAHQANIVLRIILGEEK
ncbi:MAG: thiamine biosynthesis protein ThiF, partial [Fusobacterium periodonticum]|nr:thiamine biosynthesis protein ThiF [Fusobacterium periodonticum]